MSKFELKASNCRFQILVGGSSSKLVNECRLANRAHAQIYESQPDCQDSIEIHKNHKITITIVLLLLVSVIDD